MEERNDMKFDKRNPFEVPDNYFETLFSEVMEQVDRQPLTEKQGGRVVSMREKMKPALYMAAMFTGIYLLMRGLIPFMSPPHIDENEAVSSLETSVEMSDEEQYFLSSMSEYVICEYFASMD